MNAVDAAANATAATVNANANAADLLVCDQLGVGLPGRPLLATVHTQLAAGRVTAILGPNGAGKSTLLAMLSGQRAPRSGRVWLGGQPVSGASTPALARQRAVLPQDTAVAFDFTVQEVVEMGRFAHRQQPSRHEAHIVAQAMEATGVAHLAGRSINTLSGGERARSHLARALAQIWEPLPDGAPAGCCWTSPPPPSTWPTSTTRWPWCAAGRWSRAWAWSRCCTT